MTDKENLDIVRAIHEMDACEICFGEKGGVPGNENIVTVDEVEKIACDYCTSAITREKGGQNISLITPRKKSPPWREDD